MSDRTLAELARRLCRAEETATPIAPFAGELDSPEAAYTVQDLNTRAAIARGAVISGRKIGLTDRATQARLGIDTPVSGTLLADRCLSPGAPLDTTSLIAPRLEAEIALVMGRDLTGTGLSGEDLAGHVAAAVPAFDIVDTRVAGWQIGPLETIADNAAAAAHVLGAAPRPIAGLDLTAIGFEMWKNGTLVSSGSAAASTGHPLDALAWLSGHMIARGTPLQAGQVVLTGALGPAVALSPGDRVVARFSGFPDLALDIA